MPIEIRMLLPVGTYGWISTICRPSMYSGTRGPGTLVVTVCTSGCGNRNAIRVPRASKVGAANPASSVSAWALTAWRLLLVVHLLAHLGQPGQRVGLADRQVHQDRGDPVVQRAPLLLGADGHGNHRADDLTVDQLAAPGQQVAEPSGDGREDHVVDGAADRLTDELDLPQALLRPFPAPVRAGRPVEGTGRRADQPACAGRQAPAEVEDLLAGGQVAGKGRDSGQLLERLEDGVAEPVRDQPRGRRRGPGPPRLAGGQRLGFRRGI